jgi:hypothetical protein
MQNLRQGQFSLGVLIFATVVVILATGFVFLAVSFLQLSVRSFNKTLAFSMAEAGVEYYRWHLAHDPVDYYDGQGSTSTGPYVHDYYNKNGQLIGRFALTITPPATGTTVVTIRSEGTVVADPSIKKIIEVRMGIPSFATYAVAANDVMRFGTGTEVFGEIISNYGIRFDGIAHNLVKSAVATYDDPDHGGQDEFGVHTHSGTADPLPPASVPDRPDVFMVGREFPVPAVDFAGITQDLADLRTLAQSGGYYASSSGAQGYNLVISPSGTYSVYRVTATVPAPNGCTNTSNQDGWGTWSIQSETLHASGTIPANGIFFFEDNVWVRGTVSSSRVTVASGRFPDNPSTRTSITVNEDVRYTYYDGRDAIAFIAQEDFNVGLYSNDILRIDGAIIAQNGRIGRYYYSPPNNQSNNNRCGPTVVRQRIILYGMIASDERYGFGYTDSTGYQTRELIYDANLMYGPPSGFPLVGDQYVQISWEEIQ